MCRVDEPWRHDGNGTIEDAMGVPVAFISAYHASQVPLIVAAPKLLAAAIDVIAAFKKVRVAAGTDALTALKAAIDESDHVS